MSCNHTDSAYFFGSLWLSGGSETRHRLELSTSFNCSPTLSHASLAGPSLRSLATSSCAPIRLRGGRQSRRSRGRPYPLLRGLKWLTEGYMRGSAGVESWPGPRVLDSITGSCSSHVEWTWSRLRPTVQLTGSMQTTLLPPSANGWLVVEVRCSTGQLSAPMPRGVPEQPGPEWRP